MAKLTIFYRSMLRLISELRGLCALVNWLFHCMVASTPIGPRSSACLVVTQCGMKL